ncbi:hypothetical protein [Pseudomonas aeruginosa]|uniref:hypothetical protein n=1 Tax=Pseudomonas aeruginosa TaxID=287 RepID=UPI00232CFB07|nr:hypothetical protein [Pseudomonas aeruginosa]
MPTILFSDISGGALPMVANFKGLVLFLMILPFSVCSAEQLGEDGVLVELIRRQLDEATVNAQARVPACLESDKVLPADLFDSLELTDEDKRVTLLYSLTRNQWACRKGVAMELLLARQMARQVGLPVFSEADDPAGRVTAESVSGRYSMLGYEARYLAIAQGTRARLEAIEALRQPFDLIRSAQALGIHPRN